MQHHQCLLELQRYAKDTKFLMRDEGASALPNFSVAIWNRYIQVQLMDQHIVWPCLFEAY